MHHQRAPDGHDGQGDATDVPATTTSTVITKSGRSSEGIDRRDQSLHEGR